MPSFVRIAYSYRLLPMTAIHQLCLGVLSLFGGMSQGAETPRDIEHLTDELKESLKKSDKERLLEDRRHIERDMRIALEKTKLELHL